jgi:hypothetical protein
MYVKRQGKIIQGLCDPMTTQGLGERVDSYRGTSVATLEKIFEKLSKTS